MRREMMQSRGSTVSPSPMSPSLSRGGGPATITATAAGSCPCFALAWHAWNLCVIHGVLVLISLVAAAVVVVVLPFACIAASLCLICEIPARLITAPSSTFVPPGRTGEHGRGSWHVHRREQGCVAVVGRGSSEVGTTSDDGAFTREEEEHGGEAELEVSGQECAAATCVHGDDPFTDPCADEQERFFLVDTGNQCYYKRFYDLLAFWRWKEEGGRR